MSSTIKTTPRDRKILKISQAHLAPGMNLHRWREILDRHYVGKSWDPVSDRDIDNIIAEISAIIRQAKEGATND